MQGIIQPLYDGCLLSVTTSGTFGDSWTPTIGLRTGCRLKATLFGLFIDGLHGYWRPMLQVQPCRSSSCPCALVYANDICLLASSTEHLQALLDVLAS